MFFCLAIADPLRPSHVCPKGTTGCNDFGCPDTCYCEDHCSWERCLLDIPPTECLIPWNRTWMWNNRHMYWYAKFPGNILTYWD